MKFPKKQGQRLIPEYLLDYTTKLNESHPDPTESWGGGSGGGTEYTAGNGIDITNNVISVDDTIAKKSEIPSLDGYATQTWVQEQGYKTSITSSDITNALGYTPGTSNFSGSYNDLTDTPTLATVATTGSYNDLIDKPTIPTKTSELDNDSGYITNVTWNDITNKPTFANVATSGSYNDLLDKPTIPDTTNFVTIDTAQTISGAKTFQGGLITENTTFGMKMNIVPSRFVYTYNNQGTIEKTLFDLPNKVAGTEQEPTTYIIATTDDIPTVNNPTITFTQGGTTKGTITLNQSGDQTIEFDAGGGGGKLYLHKLHIKKYYLKDTKDREIASSLHLYCNITTSSNQPMTLDTYKAYFTGDSTVSDYGFATSGKLYIMGSSSGEASVTSVGFTNNNMIVVQYYQSRNSSANNSRISGKFDSVDGFEDTVTEV